MTEDEEKNLSPGQRMIVAQLRHLGRPIDAESYAFLDTGRDIDELGAEELEMIPRVLLDPWIARRDNVDRS